MKFENDISEHIILKGNFYFNTKRDLFLRKYFCYVKNIFPFHVKTQRKNKCYILTSFIERQGSVQMKGNNIHSTTYNTLIILSD